MKQVSEFTRPVADTAELKDLEQFVARQGGHIKLITANRNGRGLSVTYQIAIEEFPDDGS